MVSDTNEPSSWLPHAEPPPLKDREVHLWLVQPDAISERLPDFSSILSRDEQERAARFHKRIDAKRYASTRASLRCLLGNYLRLDPQLLRFAYDSYGKPRLSEEAHSVPLRFSVSHSSALALFGVVLHRNIGVDIEYMRSDVEVTDLAERFFSRREAGIIGRLSGELRLEAFFRCWTRKEAYLKALGQGLSYGLDRVEVTLTPDEPAVILRAADDLDVSKRWTLQDLAPAPGYFGAAAVEGTNLTFKRLTTSWTWLT
jgi:4'-phosphopantetheinyl transferase